jgi:hypothetical protein
MAAAKAKTLQDLDLKSRIYDEMIKWLDDNIEDALMVVLGVQKRPK